MSLSNKQDHHVKEAMHKTETEDGVMNKFPAAAAAAAAEAVMDAVP